MRVAHPSRDWILGYIRDNPGATVPDLMRAWYAPAQLAQDWMRVTARHRITACIRSLTVQGEIRRTNPDEHLQLGVHAMYAAVTEVEQ